MTGQELYQIYSKWTGELHFFCVRNLGRHLDCEYFPDQHQFKVYSGYAVESFGTVPGLTRPEGERSLSVELLRPEDDPTREDLELLFKEICLAAARVLKVPLGRQALPEGEHGDEDRAQRRLERNLARPLPGKA